MAKVVLLAAAGNLTVLACQTLVGVTKNAENVATMAHLLVPSVPLRSVCPEAPLPVHNPAAVSGIQTITSM
jgi:hypothetical protein